MTKNSLKKGQIKLKPEKHHYSDLLISGPQDRHCQPTRHANRLSHHLIIRFAGLLISTPNPLHPRQQPYPVDSHSSDSARTQQEHCFSISHTIATVFGKSPGFCMRQLNGLLRFQTTANRSVSFPQINTNYSVVQFYTATHYLLSQSNEKTHVSVQKTSIGLIFPNFYFYCQCQWRRQSTRTTDNKPVNCMYQMLVVPDHR